MTKVKSPLYIGNVNGKEVRFFISPLAEEDLKPDLPWVSFEDVHVAANFARSVRKHMTRRLREDWKNGSKTIATTDGLVVVVPHPYAQGAFDAAVDLGLLSQEERHSYDLAAMEAGKALTKNMPNIEGMMYLIDGVNRQYGYRGE